MADYNGKAPGSTFMPGSRRRAGQEFSLALSDEEEKLSRRFIRYQATCTRRR